MLGSTERIRLEAASADDVDLGAADVSHLLRTTKGQGWSVDLICSTSACSGGVSSNAFLAHTPEGFVAGATSLGCLGTSAGLSYPLPTQGRPSGDCATLAGIDHDARWGLIASVEPPAEGAGTLPDLFQLQNETLEPFASIGAAGFVRADAESILIVAPTELAEFFPLRICRYPELGEDREIIAVARTSDGVFVVSEDDREVFVSRFVQTEGLNTCSGTDL
jgi:hypothetical protein